MSTVQYSLCINYEVCMCLPHLRLSLSHLSLLLYVDVVWHGTLLSAARGCVFAWGSGKKGQLGMGPERNGTVNEPQKGEGSTTAFTTADL